VDGVAGRERRGIRGEICWSRIVIGGRREVVKRVTASVSKACGRAGGSTRCWRPHLQRGEQDRLALLLMIVVQRLGVNIAPLIAGLGVTGFISGLPFRSRSEIWRRA
jgi:hypothetical protein